MLFTSLFFFVNFQLQFTSLFARCLLLSHLWRSMNGKCCSLHNDDEATLQNMLFVKQFFSIFTRARSDNDWRFRSLNIQIHTRKSAERRIRKSFFFFSFVGWSENFYSFRFPSARNFVVFRMVLQQCWTEKRSEETKWIEERKKKIYFLHIFCAQKKNVIAYM